MSPDIPDIHQIESAFNTWRANRAQRAPTNGIHLKRALPQFLSRL